MGNAINLALKGGTKLTVAIGAGLINTQLATINQTLGELINVFNPFLTQLTSFKNATDAFGEAYKVNIDLSKSVNSLIGELANEGSTTLNLIERLRDFDAGIRTNSKELNSLQAKMRTSDQETDLSRKVFAELSYNTFQNKSSVDVLAQTVMDTAKDSMVSETKLLNGILALNQSLVDQAFLSGMEEELKQLVTKISGETGIPEAALNRVMTLMMSSEDKYFTARERFGLGRLSEQLAQASDTESRQKLFMDSVRKMVDGLRPYAEVQGDRERRMFLEALGVGVTGYADLVKLIQNQGKFKPGEGVQPIGPSGVDFYSTKRLQEEMLNKFDTTMLTDVRRKLNEVLNPILEFYNQAAALAGFLVPGMAFNPVPAQGPIVPPNQQAAQQAQQQAVANAQAAAKAAQAADQEYDDFKKKYQIGFGMQIRKSEDISKQIQEEIVNKNKELNQTLDLMDFYESKNLGFNKDFEEALSKENEIIEELQTLERNKEYTDRAKTEGLISRQLIDKIDQNIELESSTLASQKELLATMGDLSIKMGRFLDKPTISRATHGTGNVV